MIVIKIAYIAFLDVSHESGVLKKIMEQINCWIEMGISAKLFFFTPNKVIWDQINDIPYNIVEHGGGLKRFYKIGSLTADIKLYNPDLIYMRFGTYYPQIEWIMKLYPTVLELNTNHVSENKLVLSKYKRFYHNITAKRLLASCSGMICVTNEIMDTYRVYSKYSTIISNGINLSRFPTLPPVENKIPVLVFVGSPGFVWHGVDKIIDLAHIKKSWKFEIIGYKRKDISYIIPENITFHGYLGKEEYEDILKNADVAIGSLAIHRNELNEACPLKVREYMAYGIPTIIGYKDSDLSDRVPFVLEITNNETNIIDCHKEIGMFVETWKGKRIDKSEVYFLDSSNKERQRVEFFKKVISLNN